jgi:Leucine-rich repeat (LRR) protein
MATKKNLKKNRKNRKTKKNKGGFKFLSNFFSKNKVNPITISDEIKQNLLKTESIDNRRNYEFIHEGIVELKLLKKLKTLNCSGWSLKKLPELPPNLEKLNCSDNQLEKLPELSEGLKDLICFNNKLTELLPLPQNLEKLHCSNNLLKNLPDLPPTLTKLVCNKNKNLTELPNLPDNLIELRCEDNNIELLPEIPKNIEYLFIKGNPCYDNFFISLFDFPNLIATDAKKKPLEEDENLILKDLTLCSKSYNNDDPNNEGNGNWIQPILNEPLEKNNAFLLSSGICYSKEELENLHGINLEMDPFNKIKWNKKDKIIIKYFKDKKNAV